METYIADLQAQYKNNLRILRDFAKEMAKTPRDPLIYAIARHSFNTQGKIIAGEIKKLNGNYVGAVAFSCYDHQEPPTQIMHSAAQHTRVSQRKSKSPLSLAERAAAMLRGPVDD